MADKKISALPAATGVTADDLFAIVDDPGGAPITQKATAAQLAAYIGTTTIQVYQGRAPAAPDDPTKPALDYPVGGGGLQQWNIGTGTWV
jgi:hypothetical protein